MFIFGMDSFNLYSETKDSTNRLKAISTVIDALKDAFSHFDISTRRLVWNRLTSKPGEELIDRLLRNPHTSLSDSEFRKLIEGG